MTHDQRRAKVGTVADEVCPASIVHVSSSMISQNRTAFFSPRISGMVLFFFVQGGSIQTSMEAILTCRPALSTK